MSILCFIFMLVSLGLLVFARLHQFFFMTAFFKILTSLLFLAIAYFAQKELPKPKPTKYFKRMFLGLCLCALGDLFLVLNTDNGILFILGTVSFAAAHIAFSFGFFCYGKIQKTNLFLVVLIFAFANFLTAQEQWIDTGNMKSVVMIYVLLISFMFSQSFILWQYRKENSYFTYTTILAVTLFIISDFVLLFATFPRTKGIDLRPLNNTIYYVAQGILGLSFRKEILLKKNCG